jgi:hypothetical protein
MSTATVIPITRKRGRPAEVHDLALELEAREEEEREQAAKVAPIIHIGRRSRDPHVMAAALIAAEAFIVRHQRRWSPTGPEAA